MRRRGRVLAMKLGMNPNSSSLGGDVTFLLLGATALGLFTPIVASLLRLRRPTPVGADAGDGPAAPAAPSPPGPVDAG